MYHVSPGATSPDALAQATELPTLLGPGYPIKVGKDAATGKVTLSGLFPDNTAAVVSSTTVCGSQVGGSTLARCVQQATPRQQCQHYR